MALLRIILILVQTLLTQLYLFVTTYNITYLFCLVKQIC